MGDQSAYMPSPGSMPKNVNAGGGGGPPRRGNFQIEYEAGSAPTSGNAPPPPRGDQSAYM
ncbi:hypothetical protein Mgra_00007823 [Meloidogyne graminicola]|uniref:Uncharacterized protein n=1 Tax=Meloidogyne graminicola TaxID=189291 RepID=A0A8S9ZHP4_9BILA|nr:hypothetical protein Mgra_00007823 [Meloidogyne graminicola]